MDRLFEIFGGGQRKKHEKWERQWKEKKEQQDGELTDATLTTFAEPGVIRTSQQVELRNTSGEVVKKIEPNEP